MYVISASGIDFVEAIKPKCSHEDPEIRSTAFYEPGKLPKKEKLIPLFEKGLNDSDQGVVHTTLQALKGVRHKSLVESYLRIIDRFETDEHLILTNLNHILKDMGYNSIEKFIKKNKKNR